MYYFSIPSTEQSYSTDGSFQTRQPQSRPCVSGFKGGGRSPSRKRRSHATERPSSPGRASPQTSFRRNTWGDGLGELSAPTSGRTRCLRGTARRQGLCVSRTRAPTESHWPPQTLHVAQTAALLRRFPSAASASPATARGREVRSRGPRGGVETFTLQGHPREEARVRSERRGI